MTQAGAHRPHGSESVVLVHGLWVCGAWMRWMRRRIAERGYRVSCFSYPSMRCSMKENAARLSAYCGALDHATVHLVGHS
ncbi:MAG TPA: alpha/beta hydrolase, partial [Burkholderiales bacterium]|nr:alpha/beta hydrolase [Burkholderiales bacterium]